MDRQTLTVVEAAKALGIGRGQAYEAVRRGDIPSIRLGKRLVIPRQAFDRLLEAPTATTK
jgi:excisionase family DNA binding protein